MKKELKLSEAQKKVIRAMQEGDELFCNILTQEIILKNSNGMCSKIQTKTFDLLYDKDVIERYKNQGLKNYFRLTDLGKTLAI